MNKGKKIVMSIFLCLVLIFLGCYYEIYISYNKLQTKTYELESESTQLKVVVISDLHENNLANLCEQIREQSPDSILVVGDMINSTSQNSLKVTKLMKQLVKISPVYYSLGNHELEYIEKGTSDLVKDLKSTGVVVLDKNYVDININNSNIRIGGMYEYAFGNKGNLVKKENMDKEVYNFLCDFQDTDNYKIMMAHRPDSFIFGDASKVWNIDLVVSGHNHGGQVILPFLGGLYGGDQGWFPEYVDGMYKLNNINLFVTRGLGSNEKKLPRFNNRPEISIIDIKKAYK